ncbi:Glycosyl transferase, family II [Desulfonema limicola]|uniref:Glycosyl transferase, family II n=1 Tax=Desulfonema limicola TaxID=45656 RepID=A0A975B6N6_9BACT|nr:glycosyltransferase family 2 protein [Desulfonema limicola]QTA79808.1 Glycosyl transferase, family II [Desulfonema limicola]
MKKKCQLSFVTFCMANEAVSDKFIELAISIQASYHINIFVIADQELNNDLRINYNYDTLIIPQKTKYERILKLFEICNSEFIIFVDSDISLDIPKVLSFINHTVSYSYDIAWGKIKVSNYSTITSRLVSVDKLLSHDVIRPLLWRFGLGITIPGQLFILRKAAFHKKLNRYDTFLDDISFGLFVKRNHLKIHYDYCILGYENPNNTFYGLLKQRKRWATGFSTIVKSRKNDSIDLMYLFIHVFFYHLLWVPFWIGFFSLFNMKSYLAFLYAISIIIYVCRKHLSLSISAILYCIVFPVYHIWWFICFIKESFDKNNIKIIE